MHGLCLRSKRWLSALQMVLLVLVTMAPATTAAATQQPPTGIQLVQVLQHYGIVKGDETGNLNLDKPITRAEMITILVRSLGAEREAAQYVGYGLYSDARGHWAEGNIAYATNKRLIRGDGDGLVRPNDPLTYAEAFTMILRLVGKEPTSGEWPHNVLVEAAVLKLVPEGVSATNFRQSAIRGLVFQSLALAVTSVETTGGQNFLQTYVDSNPPTLRVDAIEPTKAESVTVNGTAGDAVRLAVNGKETPIVNGRFSSNVSLEIGSNSLLVEAWDMAGNKATQTLTVVRQSPIARLSVTGPATARIGEEVTFTITAFDEGGRQVPVENLAARVTGNIGTYDVTSNTFKAGNSTGSGTIVLVSGSISASANIRILGPSDKAQSLRITPISGSVPVSRPMVVEVRVTDSHGELVSEDNGREVILQASGVGLSVTPAKATTKDGIVTFTVVGTAPGPVTLTAASPALNSSVQLANFGSTTRVVLRADSTSLVSGGSPASTRVYAELRDESGNLVLNNSGSDITIHLTQAGAVGSLNSATLTIQRGNSTSLAGLGTGSFAAGSDVGQVLISGSITSGHTYTVDHLPIWITRPTAGSGARMDILNVNPILAPGNSGNLVLRVLDAAGNSVTTGSYAFLVRVDTSNNEPKTNGLPEGVTLTLSGTSYSPVETGVANAGGNYIVGRTINGVATLTVSYNKSGIVTLTPVQSGPANAAYGHDGFPGLADGSWSFTPTPTRVSYAGTAAGLSLKVDSALGKDQSAGALNTSSGGFFTLRATVVDTLGGRVPGSSASIALEPLGTPVHTTPPGFPQDRQNAVDGIVEFRVQPKGIVGCDSYRVTTSGGAIHSPVVTLCVQNTTPAQPTIITTRGTSGTNNRVRLSDSHIEIELGRVTTPSPYWVSVVVYQDGSQIYTSDVVDLTTAAPRITVPRNVLRGGQHTYAVALSNGSAMGPRSSASAPVTVDYTDGSFGFHRAYYDASPPAVGGTGKKLIFEAYNLSLSHGMIDPSKLVIRDANGTSLDLNGAAWAISAGNRFTVDLSTAPAKLAALESGQFSGTDVTVAAHAGWYYQATGATGGEVPGRPVGPMGSISSVLFDVVTNRLLIAGEGFTTGTINPAHMEIRQGSSSVALSAGNVASWSVNSDSLITVVLTPSAANDLKNPTLFNGADTFSASLGWLSGGSYRNRAIGSVPVSAQVSLQSVSYVKRVTGTNPSSAQLVIYGSGFFSGGATPGTVDLSKLQIRDLSLNQERTLAAGTATVVSDGEIRITISNADADLFEQTFGGPDIYVIGLPGWFRDPQNRSAQPIPERFFRLNIN